MVSERRRDAERWSLSLSLPSSPAAEPVGDSIGLSVPPLSPREDADDAAAAVVVDDVDVEVVVAE
eukprot:CAMPEP_0198358522 /NCGR_PEP_ID=MMETSP1450-20131203/131093_1 /TAXON_ID=753684 ORGANISM="Madagascaria erythrocladiodes, Strain CCMP3234" /NCGR_SAMPLE_ID=MMETSP1450 /ASSEMBLY_ACC=CAM_ASM_001115 /LENGTH=64 /DNA_ID=CAMNT_0044065273 /DNA_START=93 /DNA_END=284 /DNA_ORIENTATION=-